MNVVEVPAYGPLSLQTIYSREALNRRFGGNRYSGIVPSKREPVILLFHTKEPSQQFYSDGFDSDGIYWYSGEGTKGNMTWTAANRSIRDHVQLGYDLMLFERVSRKGGLWRFTNQLDYLCHKNEVRKDKDAEARIALIFGLVSSVENINIEPQLTSVSLAELRRQTESILIEPGELPVNSVRTIYSRSAAVRCYALARAKGVCEACKLPAPFRSNTGEQYLEVHHIDRLADRGLDHISKVAAICPNCHRRCHYSEDALLYNDKLRQDIFLLEENLKYDNKR